MEHTPAIHGKNQPFPTSSSRLPGFYELAISERLNILRDFSGLGQLETSQLGHFGTLSGELVDVFIENGVGTFGLPLGIATNFLINGRDVLVPMAVEETSVLAAASHGAKLTRSGGGFSTTSTESIMSGQIQLFVEASVPFREILEERREDLLAFANRGQDSLVSRGGGACDLTWHYIQEIRSLVVMLHVDTRDAMGANIVNTMCEKLSAVMPDLFPCEIGLRILTNLCDRRLARAECRIPAQVFDTPKFKGSQVVDRIYKAWQFAWHDIHRATTNNKGVMNGIDPVLIATGNDWRAVEAGAHAWTARTGVYRPLADWSVNGNGDLVGVLEMPMAVGTVGGVTKLHPTAQAALKLLGMPTARQLAEVVVSVGLAQNLSALRALASEGIQRGHMSLHQKNLELMQIKQRHDLLATTETREINMSGEGNRSTGRQGATRQ